MDSAAIVASGLVKRFGDVPALDGIDFFVPPGTNVYEPNARWPIPTLAEPARRRRPVTDRAAAEA